MPHPSTPTRPQRRATLAMVAVLALVGLLVGPAPAAHAANYRYWGYWQLSSGTWGYAQKGPEQVTPADGTVEGWRYGIDDGSGSRPPRAVVSFDQVCKDTPTQAGKKRVAVVLDFGRPVDSDAASTPPAAVARCAQVAADATGALVLAAVATVRSDKGLICGLNGFPASGCASEVATLTEAQKAKDEPITLAAPAKTTAPVSSGAATTAAGQTADQGSSPTALIVVGLLVLAAIVAAVLLRRRRPSGA